MKIEVDRPRLPKDVEAIIDEFPLAVRTLTRVAHLAMAAAYTDARGMGRWECDERADLHRAAADA